MVEEVHLLVHLLVWVMTQLIELYLRHLVKLGHYTLIETVEQVFKVEVTHQVVVAVRTVTVEMEALELLAVVTVVLEYKLI